MEGGPDFDTSRDTRHAAELHGRYADERSGAPLPTEGPDPTGDDPFDAGAREETGGIDPWPLDPQEEEAVDIAKRDQDGPPYEVNDAPGGSSDPSDTLSFSDSGNGGKR